MIMSLELFIGKKTRPSSSDSESEQVKHPSDSKEKVISKEISWLPINSLTKKELEKRSSKELVRFLIEAVRQHPLYLHHASRFKELLNDSSYQEKTLKEMSALLQLSEGYVLGLLIIINNSPALGT